jgi:hypothetical protein
LVLETLVSLALWSLALNAGAEVSQLSAGAPARAASRSLEPSAWPLPNQVHPLAKANVELSAQAFAALAAALEPTERLKAIHDWVTLVLHYESNANAGPALAVGRRATNCQGYAQLFAQLGRAAGLEVEVVQGLLKVPHGPAQPHAWNAVRLSPKAPWQLVDVTLDDPTLRGDGLPEQTYRTDYLLVPPALAALDHWPFQASWQLGAPRPSRAAFDAGRLTSTASLVRSGLVVRAQGSMPDGGVVLTVDNPTLRYLLLAVDGAACGAPLSGPTVTLSCPAHAQRLELLVHEERTGLFLTIFEFSN